MNLDRDAHDVKRVHDGLGLAFAEGMTPSRLPQPRIIVIGGGNAGLSVAGRLARAGMAAVSVIEPREVHVFAPLQSHIAGGVARASDAARPQAHVTPDGVSWVRDEVALVSPADSTVTLASGSVMPYDQLVIAAGIELRWDAVPGLAEAMRAPSGISNYTYELAAKASPALRDLTSGTVVFVQPPEPASAGGVAQKPMYLACDWWRRRGVRDGIRVVLISPESAAFGIPAIAQELQRKVDEYGIETHYDSDVREVRPGPETGGEVVVARGGISETITYDLLHAVPPQAPSEWIQESGLAEPSGFVDVDPSTLRHRTYDNVWALGDAAAVAIRRSGGAIRKQSKVLATNLRAVVSGGTPSAHYDGYSVCPITVSRRTVVFAEFDGDDRLAPTIPFWKTSYRESRLAWVMDRHILPWVYWNLILTGRA